MKKFQKILACVMAVATLGIASTMTVSADVVLDNSEVYIYESPNYTGQPDYQLPNDFDIQDIIEDENHTIVLDGTKFTLQNIYAQVLCVDGGRKLISYDITDNVISTIEEENSNEDYYIDFVFNREDNYPYSYVEDSPKILKSVPLDGASAPTVGESSITEFTVGESTYPRGDINLDGNVNTVDLLMLKKYLLGLMEW